VSQYCFQGLLPSAKRGYELCVTKIILNEKKLADLPREIVALHFALKEILGA
jgi:hypothetical protein